MVIRCRKKPVEVQAMQFRVRTDAYTIYDWIVDNGGSVVIPETPLRILLSTLEGEMRADLGDWIIRGVKGEFYPCKADIFEATYEVLE